MFFYENELTIQRLSAIVSLERRAEIARFPAKRNHKSWREFYKDLSLPTNPKKWYILGHIELPANRRIIFLDFNKPGVDIFFKFFFILMNLF